MDRFAVILWLLTRVNNAMRLPHHYPHYTSEYHPSQSEYIYDQITLKPWAYELYPNEVIKPVYEDINEIKIYDKMPRPKRYFNNNLRYSDAVTEYPPLYDFMPYTEHSDYYERSRKKMNTPLDMMPDYKVSDLSDIMISRLKARHHSVPPNIVQDSFYGYDTNIDFLNDDEDVRTSGRGIYDYYAPFLYQMPFDSEGNKSSIKDRGNKKRFIESPDKVLAIPDVATIPKYVYENKPNNENPIGGNGPFFSFVLNDYFDKNHDDDSLSFKGVEWSKDFDHESYKPSLEDSLKRNRLIDDSLNIPLHQLLFPTTPSNNMPLIYENIIKDPNYEIQPVTQANSQSSHESDAGSRKLDRFETDKKSNSGHKNAYDFGNHKQLEIGDFIDSIANQYGAENHKKNSHYIQGENADKGQKNKGFHRVYHKDEFSEDKEFYDNTNSSAQAADKGSSNFNIGGLENVLRKTSLGAFDKVGSVTAASGHSGKDKNTQLNNIHDNSQNFNKYINVAKEAASSNRVDYTDDNIKI